METFTPECAAQSVGPANQLFSLLIQTILTAQCAISPKDMWPEDYGPTALEKGSYFLFYHVFFFGMRKVNWIKLIHFTNYFKLTSDLNEKNPILNLGYVLMFELKVTFNSNYNHNSYSYLPVAFTKKLS